MLALALTTGCVSVSYTETGGGGSGQDASSCINLSSEGNGTRITNNCDAEVNFIEFSSGSSGLLRISANGTVTEPETVSAWGACIAPSVPRRTGDFEYYCEEA